MLLIVGVFRTSYVRRFEVKRLLSGVFCLVDFCIFFAQDSPLFYIVYYESDMLERFVMIGVYEYCC